MPARKAKWRLNWVSGMAAVAAVAGLLAVVYPQTAAWWSQHYESKAIDVYQDRVKKDPPPRNAVRLAQAREYNKLLSTGEIVVGADANKPVLLGQKDDDSGYWDLLDETPEITVASRKQSRRGTRIHRGSLDRDDIALSHGLPTTTPARTAADLLRDGHDPTHVAEIVGEALQRGLASRQAMATALDPLAPKFERPDGSSLLEHLLDLVGLSTAALTKQVASSQ